MDDAEIRAEIERRRKKAVDLKLRETLWNLYAAHFQYIDKNLKENPGEILPAVRESLRRIGNESEFRFMDGSYRLICIERHPERHGRRFNETETTDLTISLSVEGERVFEFEMTKSITYGEDMPYFSENMRSVTAFVEGAWVENIAQLKSDMETFRREYWKEKNALKDAQKLRDDRKRFGL
jgi:hypothetical protein